MAECFCDQTLLTPSVDNLGNSSSSPARAAHCSRREGPSQRRLIPSFEWGFVVIPAVSGGRRVRMRLSIQRWRTATLYSSGLPFPFISITRTLKFLSPCCLLPLHLLASLFTLLSQSSCFGRFHHFPLNFQRN